MTFEEAIKRLRQETAPATYCPDFDKEECLKVIEKEHKALEIIKKYFNIEFNEETTSQGDILARFVYIQGKEYARKWDYVAAADLVNYQEDFKTLKEVL